MARISRREFLGSIAAAAAGGIAARASFAGGYGTADPFGMLVLGDSLIWGQGLDENQKSYSLTRDWLEREVFRGEREVRLTVKAHSGSTLKLDPKERDAFLRAKKVETTGLHPEVNVSFPTIERQVALARESLKPDEVHLIMISGGIPDVGVAKIINPLESNSRLRERIRLYCRDHMAEILGLAADAFPSARIAVIGYYPIITRHTPMKRIVNDILELYNFPRWAKPIVNNPLNRNLWRLWKGKMVERSRIWHSGSDAAFREAVSAVNQKYNAERIVFISSPIDEKRAYGTKNSLLFTVASHGRAPDPQGPARIAECRPALNELRRSTRLKYSTRFCELASIGHPTPEGAAEIAAAVRSALTPYLKESRLAAGP